MVSFFCQAKAEAEAARIRAEAGASTNGHSSGVCLFLVDFSRSVGRVLLQTAANFSYQLSKVSSPANFFANSTRVLIGNGVLS